MAVEVIMPKLGLNMTEGTVTNWLVPDGAEVKKGDLLFELETDKATTEVEADVDGLLRHVVEAGAVVPVTGIVAYIVQPGEAVPPTISATPAPERVTSKSSESVTATRTAAPSAMPAARRRANELGVDLADVVETGRDGAITLRDVETFVEKRSGEAKPADATEQKPSPSKVTRVSPLARRMAKEAGLDAATIRGTGHDGIVTKEDVERAIADSPELASGAASEETVSISGVRAVIAEHMHASAQQTAPVTLTTEVDAVALVEVRNQLNDRYGAQLGGRISYNDILVKLVSIALAEFPHMNARQDGDQIRLLAEINVGVAVDTPRGLLVPVVRDVPSLPIRKVSQELRRLVDRAMAGKSSPHDLADSTFTITNLGPLGIDAFTPIINLPEIAILGIGRIVQKPVVRDGGIHIRDQMVLSLTFDHRLIDGAPAGRFLRRVSDLIEDVELQLLD